MVRRHAASVGIRARLASRTVADRSATRSTPASKMRRSFARPTAAQNWSELSGLRTHTHGLVVATRRRRHVPAHDSARSEATRSASSSRSRPPARFAATTPARRGSPINRGLRSEQIPDPDAEVGHCVHRIAMHPSRPDVLFMQKHWDVMRSDDARRLVARGQRQSADRFRLSDRRARARARDDLRRADQERLGALPARRKAARLPQPHRRQRMGSADQGLAAARLLRQRAARRDGGRYARFVRRLLRHDRRTSLLLRPTRGDQWNAIVRDLPAVLSVEVQTLP